MLRSLYSGISGLRAHQTMLDTTGNNIANVNTAGFKSSSVQFQDTLSQMTQGATTPQANTGGRNPAQVGLGVQVAGIAMNFTQGSAQNTGRATDMMIAGDGFFLTRSGTTTTLTRAGAFDFDPRGRLTSPDGGIVQGWMADNNGVLPNGGSVQDIILPSGLIAPGAATTTAKLAGNLPKETAVGDTITQDKEVFAADGSSRTMNMTFTRTAAGWDIAANDGIGPVVNQSLMLDGQGKLNGTSMAVGGITVDLTKVTGYAGLKTVSISEQNGRSAGSLESYTLGSDGTLTGTFSNGTQQAIAQIVLGSVSNPAGLQKTGGSGYAVTANSGEVEFGTPGAGAMGAIAGGMLEMSNVDLSQEFTNLIVAQRGFQANARIITTSDEILQELANLKR
ncbi:flagellar hook protein FlgE [Paeniglutamicibacter cryotolerans]|uniref:Flagellar hook protein FlgE n=1 Tax=Paeniglutamicibacter cryotolerans TaxID=670079 RepID=A0A839QCN7_9MICC|nr:flagellar hook protein FlgE [Paeniglutamicibacter cryotolerans]MBB2993889.1 flagellar hook protein FlgE [Paeniglutamicibacter cryotolerans]